MHTDYRLLTPDTVIHAVESAGYLSDSRILPLNSYENRVYQVGIEDEQPIIAKFYRPNRWSDEQILEEHQFTQELLELDIPVVPPLIFAGQSLLSYKGYRFALYPRRGGHAPELDNGNQREIIGRFMGRIHACGLTKTFQTRPDIDCQRYAIDSREYLLSNDFIPT